MADELERPNRSTRGDGFTTYLLVFVAVCSIVALAFAVANFFVAAHANDTAESAKETAEQALGAAQTATPAPAATTAPAAASTNVQVGLDEYSITLAPAAPPSGRVVFDVTNTGKVDHEFVLFRTDLPADALPTKKNGDVNEEARGLEVVVDSGSDMKPGATRTLHATLAPGHYVAVCNLPGHYAAGMRTDVVVP